MFSKFLKKHHTFTENLAFWISRILIKVDSMTIASPLTGNGILPVSNGSTLTGVSVASALNNISSTGVATTAFVNTYIDKNLGYFKKSPKIVARSALRQYNDTAKAYYAPSGIRQSGPTPMHPAMDGGFDWDISVVKVSELKWRINTITWDDILGIQEMGINYRFDKIDHPEIHDDDENNAKEEIFIIFDSATDEAMFTFLTQPKPNSDEQSK